MHQIPVSLVNLSMPDLWKVKCNLSKCLSYVNCLNTTFCGQSWYQNQCEGLLKSCYHVALCTIYDELDLTYLIWLKFALKRSFHHYGTLWKYKLEMRVACLILNIKTLHGLHWLMKKQHIQCIILMWIWEYFIHSIIRTWSHNNRASFLLLGYTFSYLTIENYVKWMVLSLSSHKFP